MSYRESMGREKDDLYAFSPPRTCWRKVVGASLRIRSGASRSR